jgi:hypothetical protein
MTSAREDEASVVADIRVILSGKGGVGTCSRERVFARALVGAVCGGRRGLRAGRAECDQ